MKRLNGFQEKAPSQMFEKILNVPLAQKLGILVTMTGNNVYKTVWKMETKNIMKNTSAVFL